MYFLKQPVLCYSILDHIKITQTQNKLLYISSEVTSNSIKLECFQNKKFYIYTNSKYIIIQPFFQAKKKNTQLCGLYNIQFTQFSHQILNKVFKKILYLKGIGYKIKLIDNVLSVKLGYSHEILLQVPEAINVQILKANKVMCTGSNKIQLSQFISRIRLLKKKDSYKGKGILFLNENVRQKEGKKNKK